ncbi:unnamed protein product, partial [Phytomonas sp. EM1]
MTGGPPSKAARGEVDLTGTPPRRDPRTRAVDVNGPLPPPTFSSPAARSGPSAARSDALTPEMPNLGGERRLSSRDPDHEELDRMMSKTRTFRSNFGENPDDDAEARFRENIRRRFDEIEKAAGTSRATRDRHTPLKGTATNAERAAGDPDQGTVVDKRKKHKSKCECAMM